MLKPHKATDAQPKRRATWLGVLMAATVAVLAVLAVVKLMSDAATTIHGAAVAERVAAFPNAWPVPPTIPTGEAPTATAAAPNPGTAPGYSADQPAALRPATATECSPTSPAQTTVASDDGPVPPIAAVAIRMTNALAECAREQEVVKRELENTGVALGECSFALQLCKHANDAVGPPTQAPATKPPFPYGNFPPGTW